MRLKLIACKVLSREIGLLASKSKNSIDITYIRQGYHDAPNLLSNILQNEIDKIDQNNDIYSRDTARCGDFDAIVLGYGLCGGGTSGLCSSRHKLVIPRVHDCISLFLGSKQRYNEFFSNNPATYYYTPGWIDNAIMPCRDLFESGEPIQKEVKEKLYSSYRHAVYIGYPQIPLPYYEQFAFDAAGYMGWEYSAVNGNLSLLSDLLEGNWDSERFLIVSPGEQTAQSFDENIMKVK